MAINIRMVYIVKEKGRTHEEYVDEALENWYSYFALGTSPTCTVYDAFNGEKVCKMREVKKLRDMKQ